MNCHLNYVTRENNFGENVLVTRTRTAAEIVAKFIGGNTQFEGARSNGTLVRLA